MVARTPRLDLESNKQTLLVPRYIYISIYIRQNYFLDLSNQWVMFNYNFIAFYLTFNYLDFVIEYHVKVIIARRHVQYIKYLRVHYYHWVDIYVCITITVLIFMCVLISLG
jgi:hypothetical protein